MLYSCKVKIKSFFMRLFSSPENYIKWYLNKKGGAIRTNDNGWIINQSDDFHKYCYNEGYKNWKENNANK